MRSAKNTFWAILFTLCFLITLFIFIGVSFGATLYVSPSGSNTSPYDTWEKAANLPSTAITYGNGVAGPHTYYIAPGTYVSSMDISDADQSGSTIIGTSAHGATSPAVKGQVLLTPGAGVKGISVTKTVTIKNISIAGVDASANRQIYCNGSVTLTMDNVYSYDPSGTTYGHLYIYGATIRITNSCFLGGMPAGTNNVALSNATTGYFYNCVFDQSMAQTFGSAGSNVGIANAGTGDVYFIHCYIDGACVVPISQTGTGKTYIKNSTVNCPRNISSSSYTLLRSAGSLHITNSLLVLPFGTSERLVSGSLDTDSNNIKTSQPFITKRKRTGIIVPCVDDTSGAAYAQSLESTFSSRGNKGTFFITPYNLSSYLAAVQSISSNGIFEIGCHSYSHSDLSLTGNIYSITKAGATVNVDRTNNEIVVNPGGTVTGFKAKTLAAIQTELEGFGCTIGALPATMSSASLGEIMSDSAGDQASPYAPQLLIDTTCATGYFKTEIADAKSQIESALSIICTSFATPYGNASSDLETAVKSAGFYGCRNGADEADAERLLSSIDLMQLSYWGCASYINFSSATDAQVRMRTRALCENATQTGSIIFLLAHDITECTASQWGIILDTIAEYENDIQVMSMGDALNYIKTSGIWSTADNRTYTRSWTDTTDYHLLPDSPCIDAGTEVQLGTDYEGTVVPQGRKPDIGAYEYPLGLWTRF